MRGVACTPTARVHSTCAPSQSGRIPIWAHPNLGASQSGRIPIWAHPNLGGSQSGRISLSRQAVFSALFYFAPIPLYNGVLVVGYATLFTTGPVFSLVLDEDVSESNALKFPQLYRELQVEARG